MIHIYLNYEQVKQQIVDKDIDFYNIVLKTKVDIFLSTQPKDSIVDNDKWDQGNNIRNKVESGKIERFFIY